MWWTFGGSGGGVKWTPKSLKFFSASFYDISAQKKKFPLENQKECFFETPYSTGANRKYEVKLKNGNQNKMKNKNDDNIWHSVTAVSIDDNKCSLGLNL